MQRASIGGLTPEEATLNFADGLASVAGYAFERGVTILIETLTSDQTDVVNTFEEAVAIVRQIDNPGVQAMFDSHNAAEETEPHSALVDRHFDVIKHVHFNEMDGRHPGAGTYDFLPVMQVLQRRGYGGWISVESFDFTPGPERIMTESLHHLKSVAARIPA
jgi:sugar phosphate isomerase/epimerase